MNSGFKGIKFRVPFLTDLILYGDVRRSMGQIRYLTVPLCFRKFRLKGFREGFRLKGIRLKVKTKPISRAKSFFSPVWMRY